MPKKPIVLDTDFMIKEDWYLLFSPRLILPIIIFCISIYFVIEQDHYGIKVATIGILVAFLSVIYLVYFLIRRMTTKFKELKIVENQKEIFRRQSSKQLRSGFIVFLLVVLLLFGTAIFFSTENGPFKWVLGILDFGIILAVSYSMGKAKTKGVKQKRL